MIYHSKYGMKFIMFNVILFIVPTVIILLIRTFNDISSERVFVAIVLMFLVVLYNTFKPVKYEFTDHQLIVYNGFKKSKIFYDAITEVTLTDEIIVGGNRAAKSEDAIQIDYHGKMYDNVKVSPNNKEEFLKELKNRAIKANINLK